MDNPTALDRRTVLKGTITLVATGAGTAAFSEQAVAQGDRSFVIEQGDTLFCVTALSNGESIEAFYDYFGAESHTSTGIEQEDASLLFLYEHEGDFSLVVIHDDGAAGGGGGAVTFDISGLPTGSGQWVVRDDGEISPTDTSPDWAWTAENTDGGAWRGGLNGDFEITIDPAFNENANRAPLGGGDPTGEDRIDEWHALSGSASVPDRTLLDLTKPVTISPGECVTIDIKPGSDSNPINPRSRGLIPVAILHTDDFDPATVEVSTVRFGDPEDVDAGGGASPAHGGHRDDVDGDGDDDLVLHFPTQDADFEGDETAGKLVGETTDGTPLVGMDGVSFVGGGP